MKLYKIDGEGWRRLVAISNRRVGQPRAIELLIDNKTRFIDNKNARGKGA